MKKFLILLFCFCLLGCFGGRSKPAQIYTLKSLPATTPIKIQKHYAIAVKNVSLPRYLDKPQIITQDSQTKEMIVAENNRWPEPLSNLLSNTLTADLSNQMPLIVVKNKTLSQEEFDYFLSVDILEINAVLKEKITIKGWWILSQKSGKVILREKIDLSIPVGETYADIAHKQSVLVNRLARAIALKISALEN